MAIEFRRVVHRAEHAVRQWGPRPLIAEMQLLRRGKNDYASLETRVAATVRRGDNLKLKTRKTERRQTLRASRGSGSAS